jgi:DNA-directed RNA polymerase subunit RPC12/RpoP
MKDSIKRKTETVICPYCQTVIHFMFTEGKGYTCKGCGTYFEKIGPGKWRIKRNNFKNLIKES